MKYRLSNDCRLRMIETPCVYNLKTDGLYELDFDGFMFLKKCAESESGCEADGDGDFIKYCRDENILTETSYSKPAAQDIRQSPLPSLRYLELQITRRCNLRCRHCYLGPAQTSDMSVEIIKAVLAEFQDMQGLRVLITGGEPLMHPDFGPINAILPEYNIRKVLFTNGLLINRDVLDTLNIDEIQISLDGMRRGHEELRGKGTYDKAVKAIDDCIEAGKQVSVSTMVHRENLNEFPAMREMLEAMAIRDWTVDIPVCGGNMSDNPILQLTPKEAGGFLKYGFGEGQHYIGDEEFRYGCGLHLMAVMPDGSCAKCTFYSDNPVGNISEGVGTCWSRVKPVEIDKLKCSGCEYMDQCRGGCRYRAAVMGRGDKSEKDIYKCVFYGKI